MREEGRNKRKMQNIRADAFCYLIVAMLFLAPFGYADSSSENRTSGMRRCDTQKALDQCGPNERCVQNSKDEEAQCMCQIGFELENGQCIHLATTTMVSITTVQSDVKVDSGGSSVAAGLLIPTFLVVIGVLLYLGARRYKWLQRFRLFRPNRYGNVLVTRDDDDDDDPPIA
ncbi:uncharacterized protein LOC123988189 [Osmia bicornis bicornis]|uniref:uncharacterized protein LOC123988189 n=1 Tax=Osmia bicornis bicornis TaxID=1437191 RepID=UPI001EAE9038|nr:uncharacterized protein LOC123988189 [Osmia bicornis bicornis]